MHNQPPKQQDARTSSVQPKPAGPNEKGAIRVEARFKIFDPVSKKVHVEGRA